MPCSSFSPSECCLHLSRTTLPCTCCFSGLRRKTLLRGRNHAVALLHRSRRRRSLRALKGAALLTAWQQLLEQPHVASDLFLIGTSAGAATCADDVHAIGNDLDGLIERTQAEVLASRPTAKGRRRGAKEQPSWWDGELAIGRRAARQTARRDPRSHAARQARAEYQWLLRRKQSRYTRSRAIALVNLARDNPARFWSKFKPAKKRSCPLPDAVMVEYFRDLLGQPPSHSASQDNPADIGTATPPAADGSELNEAFTAASVAQGIKSLRGGKATVGSLKLDALSVAVASLAPCLAQVFDACKRVGALPRSWALCGITPIHKGGDTNDPGNYRGIAVGSLLAKLYASMLNAMLMGWTERWDLRARGQAGFRKDHRNHRPDVCAAHPHRECAGNARCPSSRALSISRRHTTPFHVTSCGRSCGASG